MSLHTSLRSLLVRAALALLAVGLTAGCATTHPFVYNPDVSVNIAPINPNWPKHFEDLTPAQRLVWTQRGRPDLAHIMWSSVQDIMDPARVERNLQDTGKSVTDTPFAWIYTKDQVEVVFPDAGRSEERPLSDGLIAIMKYGDPQQTRMLSNNKGVRTEVWSYINQGIVLRFENGKLVNTNSSSIPAMPNYLGH